MFRYHILAFFSGAAVLVLEVLGARVIAPYLGTAFFVWVNVIGVILASLSIGYWLGGVLADKNDRLLPWIFLAAAILVTIVIPERALLPYFGALGIQIGSLVAAVFLFAPTSVVLGMVSPYLIKLAARDLAHLGKTSGSIFAVSTVGSITGTFTTGFWLIPAFTMPQLFWGLAGSLALLAVLAVPSVKRAAGMAAIAFALALGIQTLPQAALQSERIVFEKNSPYYNIRIHDAVTAGGAGVRTLLLDGSTQSAKFLQEPPTDADGTTNGNNRRLFPFLYIELSAELISAIKPRPQNMLVIGGGGYSIPEYVKARSPDTGVTVVEIDPDVTEAARRFFLRDPSMDITTIAEDGRTFLNRNTEMYEVIYTDAYSGAYTVPGHLASREAFQRIYETLADDGVLIVNIASALEGEHAKLFKALSGTLDSVFPHRATFAVRIETPNTPQNIIVALVKHPGALNETALEAFSSLRYTKTPDSAGIALLTDDFAPTDHLVESLVAEVYPRLRAYHR